MDWVRSLSHISKFPNGEEIMEAFYQTIYAERADRMISKELFRIFCRAYLQDAETLPWLAEWPRPGMPEGSTWRELDDRECKALIAPILGAAGCRRFSIMKSGRFSLTTPWAEPDDVVVIFAGAGMPHVLRDGEFYHLGPAYVRGLMHGEAWQNPEPELTTFTLI